MMKSRSGLSAILIVSAMTAAAPAHPPGPGGHHDDVEHQPANPTRARNWTNARTGEVVRGTFMAARDGRVSIERENGDVVVFAMTDLAEADRAEAEKRIAGIVAINERLVAATMMAVQDTRPPAPAGIGADRPKPPQAGPFDLFAPFVKTRWDDRWLFIESDGLPHVPGAEGRGDAGAYSHAMMVGIKAWQQQVPLPQAYTGENAWRVPLKPEFADKPVSAKEQLFRGAIAIAANGVPIFNPIKNDGRTDTFLAGELDEFGGHCGRADDYHYHIAPLQLQKVLGNDKPVAYALDGFPIYGYFDPQAKAGEDKACPLGGTAKLDELNGHLGAPTKGPGSDNSSTVAVPGLYHYHASAAYPYLNGGMRGKVTVKDDQIDPQPRANPVREAGKPLRGASITGFKTLGEKSWSLEYTLGGQKHVWNYRIEGDGKDAKYLFEFVEPDGTKKTETYTARSQRDRPPPDDNRQPPADGRRPPRDNGRDRPPGDRPPRRDEPPAEKPATNESKASASPFKLTSPAVGDDGKLPVEFTCDGASVSPPLAWAKPPAGTLSFAVTMHHIPGPPRPGDKPGEDKHVYLVLYNIPATTTSLEKAIRKATEGPMSTWGWGVNTVNRRLEYAPPCSKGPGDKKYTITVYALSKAPTVAPVDTRGATMDELLVAIKDITLGTATLDVTYSRPGK